MIPVPFGDQRAAKMRCMEKIETNVRICHDFNFIHIDKQHVNVR